MLLIADLGVRGVWQPQTMALFDLCVIDTDAKSYLSHSPGAVLASAEAGNTVMPVLSIKTPLHLCLLVDGRW